MYYLIKVVKKDERWSKDPIYRAKIVMMSTKVKELKKKIEKIFHANCEDDDSPYAYHERDENFMYLTYISYEHDGPTIIHYSICSDTSAKRKLQRQLAKDMASNLDESNINPQPTQS